MGSRPSRAARSRIAAPALAPGACRRSGAVAGAAVVETDNGAHQAGDGRDDDELLEVGHRAGADEKGSERKEEDWNGEHDQRCAPVAFLIFASSCLRRTLS